MTKVVLIFTFTIITIFIKTSHAQAFLGAISLGGNLSQVDGDQVYGYKRIGINGGVAAFYPIIPDKLFTSVEISFSQKGAYQKYPNVADPTKDLPYYTLRLNYLDVPFMVHWLDKRTVMIGTGISFGRLVSMKEVEWGKKTNSEVVGGPYDHNDWNWILDVRLPIHNRLKFNFRYNYSITKIRTRSFTNLAGEEWNRDQFNNFLTFRVVYMFNEKIRPKTDGQ